mmetsp:Transcript_49782/g.107825  ORF Transcript_49782/g.107825 Transcript_49782/m.107825 type:complete len:275 (+) Transcript_49782:426-1250(+)
MSRCGLWHAMCLCIACQKSIVVTPISCCFVRCLESSNSCTRHALTVWFLSSSWKRRYTPSTFVKSSTSLSKGQSLNCHVTPCTKTQTTWSHSAFESLRGASVIKNWPCVPSSNWWSNLTYAGFVSPLCFTSRGGTYRLSLSSCCAFHMLTTLVRDWGTMMIPGPLPGLAPGLRPGLRPCAGRGAAIDGLPLAASAGCGARTYGACACGACACAAGGGWPCRARLASTSSNAAFFLRKPSRICVTTGKVDATGASRTDCRVRMRSSRFTIAFVTE